MPYCANCQGFPCRCAELEDDECDCDWDAEEYCEDCEDDFFEDDDVVDDDDDDSDDDEDEDDDDSERDLAALSDKELRAELASRKAKPPSSAAHCHAQDDGETCDAPGIVAYNTIGALCGRHVGSLQTNLLLQLWDNRVILLNGGPTTQFEDDDDDAPELRSAAEAERARIAELEELGRREDAARRGAPAPKPQKSQSGMAEAQRVLTPKQLEAWTSALDPDAENVIDVPPADA